MNNVNEQKLIAAIALPVPLGLVPELLKATQRWHKKTCRTKGCVGTMRESGGHIVLEHGAAPATEEPTLVTLSITTGGTA